LQIGVQISEVLNTAQPSAAVVFRASSHQHHDQSEENLYLIDFGRSPALSSDPHRDTIAFGSPGFAPPEQYGRAQTTPLSDIYSWVRRCTRCQRSDPSEHPFKFPPLGSIGWRRCGIWTAFMLTGSFRAWWRRSRAAAPALGIELRKIHQRIFDCPSETPAGPHLVPPKGVTPPGRVALPRAAAWPASPAAFAPAARPARP